MKRKASILSLETPIGFLQILTTSEGINIIEFGEEISEDAVMKFNVQEEIIFHSKIRDQLNEYFFGKRKDFHIPLDIQGSEFQKKVWEALKRIPYGETCSYSDIAKKIGQPNSARAVGLANGKNPVPIVVPCHRVIGKNGKLIGFGGGLDIKFKLLELEKKHSKRLVKKLTL